MELTTTQRKTLYVFLAIAGVIATFVRIAPLIEGGDRLRYQSVSEDGYLMLTIARNLALGNGLAISDGEIPTNGTQPLMTLIEAACFKTVNGDKMRGLFLIVAVQVIVSLLTATALYLFTKRYFYKQNHASLVALLAAAFWYISPSSLMHSQNSLETGLSTLLILASLALYDACIPRFRDGAAWIRSLWLGVLLGICFLARNDACLLIAALLGVHLWIARRDGRLARGLTQAFTIGATSVVVASPWLWFNVTRFGHLVPVSGRAEAMNVAFAHNLWPAFVALLENITLFLRIPGTLQDVAATRAIAATIIVALVVIAIRRRAWLSETFSPGVAVLTVFVGALFVYYALLFGMPSFLGRYYFVAVSLFALVAAALVVAGFEKRWRLVPVPTLAGCVLLAIVCAAGLDLRIYARGKMHDHAQVVAWVANHVDERTWVAAVQTGTLGFYHDRTINLDGKVDPQAFGYRSGDRIYQYVIERNVQYIVDWSGIAQWAKRPEFAKNYELLFNDPAQNLAVLKRRPTLADTE